MPNEAGNASLPEDETEIDEVVKLEVEILALAALRRIAAEISSRLVERVEPGVRVVLGAKEHLAAIPHYRAVEASLDWLLAESEALLRRAVKETALETAAALTAAQSTLQGVTEILAFFRAESHFIGRSVTVDPVALQAAIAGALTERHFEVVLPDLIPSATSEGRDRLLRRLVRLRVVRAELQNVASKLAKDGPAPEQGEEAVSDAQSVSDSSFAALRIAAAGALVAEIDNFMAAMRESQEQKPSPLEAAIAGAEAQSLLRDGRRTLWLTANAVASGGSYKTRRHLFTTLFTGSRLTYSGGAAVAYTVVDGGTSSVILADVLYDAAGHGQFAKHGRFWWQRQELQASNLVGEREAVGTARVLAQPPPRAECVMDYRDSELETTPTGGDDEEAAPGDRTARPSPGELEALPAWRVAKCLLVLRDQIDVMAPRRSKASDGTIGDAAHRSRNSDHNPWVIDSDIGVVTALDITHDPANGCDADSIANAIVANNDPRVKFVIWNKRIANSSPIEGAAPWTWRDYAGKNPHTKHVHVSVKPEKTHYDTTANWHLVPRGVV